MTLDINSDSKYQEIQKRFDEALTLAIQIGNKSPIMSYYHSLPVDIQIQNIAAKTLAEFEKNKSGSPTLSSNNLTDIINNYSTLRSVDSFISSKTNEKIDNDYDNKTHVEIGPFSFSKSVQSIQIIEHKNIEEIPSIRKTGTMLVPYGSTKPSIVINLLFPDISSINNSLLPLIALFKVCPITCVSDSLIDRAFNNKVNTSNISNILPAQTSLDMPIRSTEEKKRYFAKEIEKRIDLINNPSPDSALPPEDTRKYKRIVDILRSVPEMSDVLVDETIDSEEFTDTKIDAFIRRTVNKLDTNSILESRFVPVALTHISLSTHPEIPNGIFCSLTMNRISVTEYMRNGMLWRAKDNTPTENPKKAFYLLYTIQKYIEKNLQEIVEGDSPFKMQTKIFGFRENEILSIDLGDEKYRRVKVSSIQAGMANYFSFPTLVGKEYPTAQHIGSSSVYANIYLTTTDYSFIDDINAYKRKIDRIFRSEIFEERNYGISLGAPIFKLFGKKYPQNLDESNIDNSFYISNISTNTDDNSPDLIHLSITFLESKIDVVKDQFVFSKNNSFNVRDLYKFWKVLYNLAIEFIRLAVAEKTDKNITFAAAIENVARRGEREYKQWRAYSALFGINSIFALPSSLLFSNILNPEIDRKSTISGIITPSLFIHTLTASHEKGFSKYARFRELYSSIFELDQSVGSSQWSFIKSAIANELQNYILFEDLGRAINSGKTKGGIAEIYEIYTKYVFAFLNTTTPESSTVLQTILSIMFAIESPNKYLITKSFSYLLSENGVIFKDTFADAMFYIMYYNPPRWNKIREDRIINPADLASAKRFLLDLYTNDAEYFLRGERTTDGEILSNGLNFIPKGKDITVYDSSLKGYLQDFENSYNDYDLPTYWDLFGPAWYYFVPSWDELGILAPSYSEGAFKDSVEVNESDLQSISSAGPNDRVPPSIFFYYDKSDLQKDQIKEIANRLGSSHIENNHRYYVGLDFDVHDVVKFSDSADTSFIVKDAINTLPSIIEARFNTEAGRSLEKSAQNIKAISSFFDDLRIPKSARSAIINEAFNDDQSPIAFQNKLFDPETGLLKDRTVKYTDPEGNIATRNANLCFGINAGDGFSPEIIKANNTLSAAILRGSIKRLGKDHAERVFSSVDSDRSVALRRLTDSTADMKDYSAFIENRGLSEVPDNAFNPIRAFPVFKLYLLDEKDKKYVWHDIFTGINSITSIEITHDKHDAGLAKIEINDPLRIIQNQYISSDDEYDESETTKLSSDAAIRYREAKEALKLRIGRPLIIKMGYASNVKGLHTVFTGRITEIVPGDTMVILAQSWKAETQAHEVEFLNSQGANPYDSSLRAFINKGIKNSEVQGLGHIYSPDDRDNTYANFIAQGNNIYSQAASTTTPIGVEENLLYYLGNADFTSLDTRLMNIWLPDSPVTITSYLRHWMNWTKNWAFPMQPLWDCLQEASRHALGYVADVVPYETRGTIFFGRPDQPYFSREISPKQMARWRQYSKDTAKTSYKEIADRISAFIDSNYFNKGQVDYDLFANKQLNFDIINGPIKLDTVKQKATNSEIIALRLAGEDIARADTFRTVTAFYKNGSYLSSFEGLGNSTEYAEDYLSSIGATTENLRTLNENKYTKLNHFVSNPPTLGTEAHQFAAYNAEEEYKYIYDIYEDSFFLILMSLMLNIDTDPSLIYQTFPGYLEFFKLISKNWIIVGSSSNKDNFTTLKRQLINSLGDISVGQSTIFNKNIDSAGESSIPLTSFPGVGSATDTGLEISNKILSAIEDAISKRQFYFIESDEQIEVPVITRFNDSESPTIDYSIATLNNITSNANSEIKNFNELNELSKMLLINTDIQISNFISGQHGSGVKTIREIVALHPSVIESIRNDLQILKNRFFQRKKEIQERPINEEFVKKLKEKLKFRYADFGLDKQTKEKSVEDFVNEQAVKIKLFIIFFGRYLKENGLSINKEQVKSMMKTFSKLKVAPNMSVFRKYHLVTSDSDIISNDIFATTKQMHNTVIIQHPKSISNENWTVNTDQGIIPMFESTPVYWPQKDKFHEIGLSFSPGLAKSIKKIKMCSEMNVENATSASITAFSNLAMEMRPMYRGSITIMGRNIKPWDVILLNDKYTKMTGPIDVERVTHHFGINTGWVTVVVPQLLCHGNPGSMIIDIAKQQTVAQVLTDTADTALNSALIAYAVFGPGAALLGTTARGLLPKLISSIYGGAKGFGKGIAKVGDTVKNINPATLKNVGDSSLVKAGIERGGNFLISGGRFLSRAAATIFWTATASSVANGVHNIVLSQNMITKYSESKGVELLPVVFTPLMLYGRPFTAGVETSEALYTTVGISNFANSARLNGAVNRVIRYDELVSAGNQISNNTGR